MDRTFVECSAIGFQSVVTLLLALSCYVLWLRGRGDHFLTWAAAWGVYVIRLACIAAYLVHRDTIWLFAHQTATGVGALLLLAAAVQLSGGFRLRARLAWLLLAAPLWGWVTIYVMNSMVVAGITTTLLLASVTMWTAVVFWRHRKHVPGGAAPFLAWTFLLWSIHHLDYPLLRRFGEGALYGVFVDVLFLFAIGLGMLFLVLGDERNKLAVRTAELEQLTRLLLQAQEDERRRIARELHDEAGQVLTAVKIELDLDGRHEASALVARALSQVRDLSNLLRPTVLDDLGLVAALRTLVDDFSQRTHIDVTLDVENAIGRCPRDTQVVVYRVVQEALTNVARHAHAGRAHVALAMNDGEMVLSVEDDGEGLGEDAIPHLGFLGMHERVTAVGGQLAISSTNHGGLRLEATIPTAAAA